MEHLLSGTGIGKGNMVKLHMETSVRPLYRKLFPFLFSASQLSEAHIIMAVCPMGADRRDHAHQIRHRFRHLDNSRRIGHHASNGNQSEPGAKPREQINQQADQRCSRPPHHFLFCHKGAFRIHLRLHPAARLVRLLLYQFLLAVQPQILLPFTGFKDPHIVFQQAFVRRPFFMGLPDPLSIPDIHPEAEIYQSHNHRKQQKARQPGVQKALPQRLHLGKKRKGDHHGSNNRRHRLDEALPVIQHQPDQPVVRSRIPNGMQHRVRLRLFQMRIVHVEQPLIQKPVLLLIDEVMLLIMDFRQNGTEAVTERFQPKRRQRQLQKP